MIYFQKKPKKSFALKKKTKKPVEPKPVELEADFVIENQVESQSALEIKPIYIDVKDQVWFLQWGTFSRCWSILSHAEFGRNDHQRDAPHFTTNLAKSWSYRKLPMFEQSAMLAVKHQSLLTLLIIEHFISEVRIRNKERRRKYSYSKRWKLFVYHSWKLFFIYSWKCKKYNCRNGPLRFWCCHGQGRFQTFINFNSLKSNDILIS